MTNLNNLGGHSNSTLLEEDPPFDPDKPAISDKLDNLLSDATQKPLEITISDVGSPEQADRTLTSDEFFGHRVFILSGSPGIPFSLICPASGDHEFDVVNGAGDTCTVTTEAGDEVDIFDGLAKVLHSDGTDVLERMSTGQPYDLPFYIPTVTDGALLDQMVIARALTIEAGAPGSRARANFIGASGDDDLILSLRKNGTEFGTVTFPNLQNGGSFSVGSATAFAAGDRLEILAPDFGSPVAAPGHSAVSITFKVEI